MPLEEIELNPDTHIYRVKGNIVPGITELLRGSGILKGAVHGSDEALWRGKIIHKALEYLNKGTLNFETVDESVLPYLTAYQKFRSDTGFTPKSWEISLYNPILKYCGTYDVEGLCGEERWLIDTKTGLVDRNMGAWVGIQTAAQCLLLPNSMTYKRFGLKLTGEGKYNLIPFNDPNDFNAFIAIVALRNWRKNHNE